MTTTKKTTTITETTSAIETAPSMPTQTTAIVKAEPQAIIPTTPVAPAGTDTPEFKAASTLTVAFADFKKMDGEGMDKAILDQQKRLNKVVKDQTKTEFDLIVKSYKAAMKASKALAKYGVTEINPDMVPVLYFRQYAPERKDTLRGLTFCAKTAARENKPGTFNREDLNVKDLDKALDAIHILKGEAAEAWAWTEKLYKAWDKKVIGLVKASGIKKMIEHGKKTGMISESTYCNGEGYEG